MPVRADASSAEPTADEAGARAGFAVAPDTGDPASATPRPAAARSATGRGLAASIRRKPAQAFALAVAAGWLLGRLSRVAAGRARRLR